MKADEAALRLVNANGIVTISKFTKDSGYYANPVGKVTKYVVKQGNVYVRRMTDGERCWGSRIKVTPELRKIERTPIIEHKGRLYISLTNPIIEKEKKIYVNGQEATPSQLKILEVYAKRKRKPKSVCVDGKVREFRDFALEPGTIVHFNNEQLEITTQ